MKRLRNELVEPADLRGEQRSRRERCPEALALPIIADNEPNFGGVVIDSNKFAERHNLGAVIDVRLCEQRQSPMVIHTRHESQEGVGQFGHCRRESEVSRSRAEMPIEFADHAILAPAQRAGAKTVAVRQRQLIFELARVWNDP